MALPITTGNEDQHAVQPRETPHRVRQQERDEYGEGDPDWDRPHHEPERHLDRVPELGAAEQPGVILEPHLPFEAPEWRHPAQAEAERLENRKVDEDPEDEERREEIEPGLVLVALPGTADPPPIAGCLASLVSGRRLSHRHQSYESRVNLA